MVIETFYPESPLLKRYIEYYYFFKSTSPDCRIAYFAFPNTHQAFNIHRFAQSRIGPDSIFVHGDPSYPAQIIVQGRYHTPLLVQLEGVLDKVTIGFKPLGLNPFIESTFGDAFPQHSQVFTGWQNDASFAPFLQAFFQAGANADRVEILETYLLSRFRPLQEESLLQNVLEQLSDFDEECRIDAIVKRTGMNTRTFNRLFYRNLGISPTGYRKVARFRHSLRNKLVNKQFDKLTSIGYESNYNDQSYFIRMYQKIAGSSPSRFFNAVEKLADNQLILKFISLKG